MEPLSFDSPAETDLVRRSSTTAKVFVFAIVVGNCVFENKWIVVVPTA